MRISKHAVAGLSMLLVAGTATPALAGDLYTLFDGSCGRTTGVLVHVDENRVLLVDLSGRLASVTRDEIHSLVLHNLLENPLSGITVDSRLKRFLRDVWVGDDDKVSFTGWATNFFDDLLIFADIDGKTHVVDPADVSKMVDASIGEGRLTPSVHAHPNLGYPPEMVPCAKQTPAVGSLPPSRVIADRIKLGGHFTKLEEAYLALDGFEERTRVYARPFVFDEASRVGLFYHQDSPLPLPFYFRWSSGRPYRFQSRTIIGNTIHDWLPFTTPSLSIASDVKSHFFNATFVGNIVALPAGTNAFVLDQITNEPTTRLGVEVSHNYIILMGADYWRLSVSAGPAYLATKFEVPDLLGLNERRVDADELSPAVRVRYLGSRVDLRAMYFNTRISGDVNDVVDENAMGTYSLRADAVRVGATITVLDEIDIAVDQIFTIGKYAERDNPGDSLELSYLYSDSNAQVSSDFGRYVTVRAYARLLARRHDVERPANLDNDNRTDLRFGAALEFVF